MTHRLLKYPLSHKQHQIVQMPRGAQIISANIRPRQGMFCWAICDTCAPMVDHAVAVLATGEACGIDIRTAHFVDTVYEGPYVWHVFSLGDVGL